VTPRTSDRSASGRVKRVALAIALGVAVAACSRKPPEATPEGAVREFTERIKRTGTDSSAAKTAFDLLAKATRDNLSERAHRYTAASGKHIAPEEMLAPQSYIERFEPHEFKSRVVGSRALVTIKGATPEQTAEISCVFQDNGWRIELPIPDLMPVSANRSD
jgi:hypothetical protein